MRKHIIACALLGLTLSSCASGSELTIIVPKGAPTIAFYHLAGAKNFEVNEVPTNVSGSFLAEDKDVIVFDSVNGLKQITGPNKAKYKLARVITNGNYYIVGINHPATEEISSSAYIVNFGQNLMPDLVYRNLYPELAANTHYVNGANDIASIVCTGKHENHDVDYAFGAMPSLWQIMNKNDCATYGKTSIVRDVQADFKTKTGLNGIAQAGIFIKNSTYEQDKDKVEKLLDEVSNSIANLKNDVAAVLDAMLKNISEADLTTTFGYTKASLTAMFANNSNLLGLTDGGVDINAFMDVLGANGFAAEAFLETYK